jgi:flagellin
MALTILSNSAAIAAENQLNITSNSLNSALEQLSSGSRINTGADDPAGLAIANGLEANITALTQSASNATDGVGELQVADGALSQVTTLLNRAVTLATESATGTVSNSQRVALDDEYTSIKAEINSIGSTTNYNGGQVFTANTLNVFLSDGSATGNSLIGVTTGLLSSTSLSLGGATNAVATLTDTPAVPAASSTSTLTGGTFIGSTAASDTLTGAVFTASAAAVGTLTSTGTAANNDTVTVGTQTYTLVTSLTASTTANQVLIGASAAATLTNLAAAVNGGTGSGTLYGSLTAVNASAVAGTPTSTTLGFTAKLNGTAGNTVATSTVSGGTDFAFGAADLAGGTAGGTVTVGSKTYTFVAALSDTPTANEVVSTSEATGLANLAAAINGAAGSGTTYGTGTVANANVTAGTSTGTTVLVSAKTAGTGGNSITATTANGGGTFAGANLSGGAAGDTVTVGATTYSFVNALSGAANEVLVGSEATSLANLAAAVNATPSGAGVTYGTGTVANTSASATATTTSATFTALVAGTAGNSIASTLTGGVGSFAAATFAGGAAAVPAGVAAAGDTVTIGTQTYTFVAALNGTPTANEVLVGITEAASLTNLANAVNGGSGSGATYGSPTIANTSATAIATGTAVAFTAIQNGTVGNAIGSSETGTGNTFGATTFAGGAAGSVNDLLSQADAQAALQTINSAVATVAALRGSIGATVNRLQAASNVITNQVQNLTAAESDVTAADIPTAVAKLTQYSILEQTGISALSQANQQQQLVLKLLQ